MNKQLNAKLQYALDGLSLAKEQKQALMDVFAEIGNNSGGASGGSSNVLYIDYIAEWEKEPILKVEDIVITEADLLNETYDDGTVVKRVINEQLYNTLLGYYTLGYTFILRNMYEVLDMNLVRRSHITIPCTFGKEWDSRNLIDTMMFGVSIDSVKLKFIVQ